MAIYWRKWEAAIAAGGGQQVKAVYFQAHGGADVLQYGDLPDPVAGPGEIVVDVHAASVNAADWKVRLGQLQPVPYFPYVLGRDFSGVVAQLGPDVTDFAIGDPVFGVLERGREGAYAEKVLMPAAIVAPKPEGLTHTEAAAAALTGLTAIVTLEDTLHLKAGETILIQGGAGGVAGFAIQLAKHLGAYVMSTASAANIGYVRSLGADEVIDYNAQDFTQVVSGIDAVFDTVGGNVAPRCYEVLKPGGRAAFIGSGRTPPEPPRPDLKGFLPEVERDRPHLERLTELVTTGAVRVQPITVYPLSEAVAAHRESEARHVRGKLVLAVR